jgi:hypothetical protein
VIMTLRPMARPLQEELDVHIIAHTHDDTGYLSARARPRRLINRP